MATRQLAAALGVLLVLTGLAAAGGTPALADPVTVRNGAEPAPPIAEPDRVVEPVEAARTTQLAGRLPAWVSAARVVGAPTPGLRLDHLTVLLARSPGRERAFQQLLEEQQSAGSPVYHRWLSPEQVGDRYGVTEHDLEAVESWLTSKGLRVEQVSKSRTVVSFGGTVAQVEAAFGVKFQRYGLAAVEAAAGTPLERLSVSGRPWVPSALASVVQAIGGLSQIPVHPYGHAEVKRKGDKPQYGVCNSGGSVCEYFIQPQDFSTIFDLPTEIVLGYGQRIAIIGRSRVDTQDIADFVSVGLGANDYSNVLIPPNGSEPGTTNDGDQLEATIDLERAVGTAPQAGEDLVVSADSSTQSGVYIASLYQVDTVLDPVMNISFGACEADAGAAGVAFWDNLASQAAGEGISLFVSSGDAGAAGCDQNNATPPAAQGKSPNYICSTSYVTCVGGTEFNDTADPAQYWAPANPIGGSALGYIPEGGWNEPSYVNSDGVTIYQASASGGGVSSIIAKPSWQIGAGVPDDGFRDTPDVAFPASAHDGYYACAAFIGADCSIGDFAYVFGTSAAAPTMAAITAMLNSERTSAAGNLNPTLYRIAGNASAGAFHDTTVESSGVTGCSLGTPSMCNNSTPSPAALAGGLAGYKLTEGYDQVTGLGSLDVQKFLSAAQPPLLTPILTLSTNSISASSNQSFPLSVTVSGSAVLPTGTVTWRDGLGEQLGAPVPLVNGVASQAAVQVGEPGDTYIFVDYSGDTTYASGMISQFLMITPAPGSLASAIVLTATPASVTVEQPVVFTATVTGSGGVPTGNVQFFGSKPLGSPVPLVNGVASSLPQAFLQPGAAPIIVAEYFGDAQYQGNSVSLDFTPLLIPAPMFAITSSSFNLQAGQATGNTAALAVTSQNNYSGTISFSCAVAFTGGGTANDPPTCTLAAPETLSLSPAEPNGSLTITIGTVAPSGAGKVAAAQPRREVAGGGPVRAGLEGVVGLLSLVFVASGWRARRSGMFGAWLVLGLLLCGIAGAAIGCGGGGNATPAPVAPPVVVLGTTAGNYIVTVLGTSRTYSTSVSLSVSVQ